MMTQPTEEVRPPNADTIGVSVRPLRIALSIWMFKPGTGGLQSHTEQLARSLIAKGHQVTVITRFFTRLPEGMGYMYDRESVSNGNVGGVPVRAFAYPRWLRPLQFLIGKLNARPRFQSLAVLLYRMQARWGNAQLFSGYDLVHHVGQATALVGFAAACGAKRHGAPFVVQPTCHPHVIGDSPLDLDLYRRAQRALVHTQYEADHLAPLIGDVPIDVVGNGIEDRSDGNGDRFRATHRIAGPIVLYTGRRESDKGYPLVMEAFRQLRQIRSDVTLVCMGPPGKIPREEVPGSIHFEFVDEQTKHDALAACTCLCVPSEGESFGLVYMEAGRYAKPVIARRLPVMQELLNDGEAGLLAGTMNRQTNSNRLLPGELAEAILCLLRDPELQARIGQACRRCSDNFTWQRVAARFEQGYQRVLSDWAEI